MLRPPYLNLGTLPWWSFVQTYDSTFSLNRSLGAQLGYWGVARYYPGMNAQPNFNDGYKYWDPKAPANSVMVPSYGLLFRVVGQASDGSAALIGLGRK
jgi:hypothetical protein